MAQCQAAEVPAGTKLAAVQELVKGNGSEPATLDPAKTEGTVESNVQRDLFEGLVTTGPKGEIRPVVAESWDTKDSGKSLPSTCAKMPSGPTVTRSPRMISYSPSVALSIRKLARRTPGTWKPRVL